MPPLEPNSIGVGALGAAAVLWVLQRAFTRFADGSEHAEQLAPKLDVVVQGVSELKASLERLTASVQSHNTDITVLKSTVEQMRLEKTTAHEALWKRSDELTKRVGDLELNQAGRRKR